jgi:tripartite-type tricarboxylate transporter receptor subunit TctC
MKRRTLIQAAPLLMGLPGLANAQAAYPNRPIKYIVPVAPGGGSDMIGRQLCDRLGKVLGQTMVVENHGGGGVIASQMAAKAAPDGYTLMQGYVATHGTAPATRKLNYDPINDYTPIGMIGSTPNVLVVNANLSVKDVKEFIQYVKKNPGQISYGSAGAGSLTHLTAELFKAQTGAFMVHIPYRGIAPATTDLIAGQTQAMFPGLAAALPHIRSGRVRALAVTGMQRHPALKDVPTMEEAGLKGFDAQQWRGRPRGHACHHRQTTQRRDGPSAGSARFPRKAQRRSGRTHPHDPRSISGLHEERPGPLDQPGPRTQDQSGRLIF